MSSRDEPFRCPAAPGNAAVDDYWGDDGCCSACGSLHPDKARLAIKAGESAVSCACSPWRVYIGARNKFSRMHGDIDASEFKCRSCR